MPLESPKSPVQHLRHRVSGFSIPGRLPCLLAVVLGLCAHQGALAQTTPTTGSALSGLPTVDVAVGEGAVDALTPAYVATTDTRTFTTGVPFGVTRVTVSAGAITNWDVEILGADADGSTDGEQRDLRLGTNTITVRATSTQDPPEVSRNYTIRVTRRAATGSALSGLALTQSGGTGNVSSLDPLFNADTNDRTFTADADLSVTRVTVDADAKPGWTVTYHDEPDADGTALDYQRNLATGANRITVRATPIGASGPLDYTITVTRTTTPGAPRSLRVTGVEDRSVGLSWTAPSDGGRYITHYEYRLKEKGAAEDGAWQDAATPRTSEQAAEPATSLDVTTTNGTDRLVNGTTYIFQVRAVNGNGDGSASNTAEATPARPLPAPLWTTSNPSPVVVGNRRVTLSWTRIPDATTPGVEDASVIGYQYRRRVVGGSYGGWTTIADADLVESGTTRSYTVTGLNNGTTYVFQVRGRNSVGGGAASTEQEGMPEAKAPGAPTNLTPTAGDGQVSLSWRAPADDGGEPITGYDYRYRPQDDSTYDDTDNPWTATGGTGTTVTVHGLMNGTTYYFQVRAVNDLDCTVSGRTDGCNEGQESLEVDATPFGKPITRVNLLTATSDEDRQVMLTWSLPEQDPPPPDDDRSGFEYRQRAGGGDGSWLDVPNSDKDTTTHVVSGLMNGTTYAFQVRAENGSGGGLASNELSAVPSTTPSAPTLTATASDEQVSLTWTPADSGGRRIVRYECQWRVGAGNYDETSTSCADNPSLGASATSLTLTDNDGITNGRTYTFRVRAVNARPANADGDWSNEASARPTDDASDRSYTISATINGKSWAKAAEASPLRATVEVNPRFTAPSTELYVAVSGGATANATVVFGPADSRRDASWTVTPSADDITIALYASETDAGDSANALAVTSVEVRPSDTPDPPTGLEAARGDGEVTLSWATVTGATDYHYRQRRQPGSYGRWTDFAGDEFQQGTTVTSNTVSGLTNGTYAFQVRALTGTAGAVSDPSDEVRVSLSGTTGGLSAPRNLAAAPGNSQVTLSWTAPASDGGAAISGYQYQQRAGTGAYGEWTAIPGGPSSRSYVVTGLTNGTRYFYRVRAVNSDGGGAPSAEESATPSLTVDTTLRALSLSTVTLAPVAVTLSPAFTPATSTYTAAVGSSVGQVTVTATPNKAGATATITPADANTTAAGHQVALVVGSNAIRVRVADGPNAAFYNITVTRAGSVPAAPTGLTATADEAGGAVTLSWTAPTSGTVSRYDYQQKAGTGVYSAWTPIPGSGASTTSYIVTGLTNDTAYAFRVRAVNSAGAGAASNEATATPAFRRLVWAKSEQEVAAVIAAAMAVGLGDGMAFDVGEQVEIPGSALFNAAEGVSLSYTAVSSDSAVASAGIIDSITVTVTAVTGGMADITITATATPPSGLTINPQTSPREASITFPVEVGLEALALTLSGPADGTNLVEGGRAVDGTAGAVTVTVTANRPVTEAVTVTLMLDRAMSTSTATADDFEAEPIVIAAGGTTGSTRVTAVEDGMAEKMEELVLFGLAAENAGPVTGEVRLRLWDAAVPVLPVVAQLLLAGLLAVGGFRRYRRRR